MGAAQAAFNGGGRTLTSDVDASAITLGAL